MSSIINTRLRQINPKKLLNSKWTAVSPLNKEKHFIVVELTYSEDGLYVISCTLEALMTKNIRDIDWTELKNSALWQQGWK